LLLGALILFIVSCGTSSIPAPVSPPTNAATPPPVHAGLTPDHITLENGLIARTWTREPYRTESLIDLRNNRTWTENSDDLALALLGLDLVSRFTVDGEPQIETLDDGAVRVSTTLLPSPLGTSLPLLRVIRSVTMYPGIAGMRVDTHLEPTLPLALSGYTLDRVQPSGSLVADLHAFRAGADWREPEWEGPPLVIGDAQGGTWRETTSGTEVSGTAQWLSLRDDGDARLFFVLERNDYKSSVMAYERAAAKAGVDFGRDVIYLGPLEESLHVGNPGSGPGRHRVLLPGQALTLEPVFTGVGLDGDDEPWQHYQYLAERRMAPYARDIVFNSNGVDDNRISTGAKDDMDFATVLQQLDIAERIGIETFVLDDGWQARSGDWCPDADVDDERCTEPRRGDPMFAPRFPDAEFKAVRDQLDPAGMRLGLWMTPLHFHPTAVTFRENPEWICLPLGAALLAANLADPYSSSSEAGIVQWNPEAIGRDGKAIDYIESRIRIAIEQWGVRYFKFDFTAWLDCVGLYPVDIYSYRESFRAMLDRVLADHPQVTLQMDETNDYRLFPFEAIARGPTWYQNGSPEPRESLHANFVLTPFIPPYALGRAALRSGDLEVYPIDYQMAVALLSHISFFNDLTGIPDAAIPRIRTWMDYYRRHREYFTQLAYPLTDTDPISGDNWAAFQTWNPVRGLGALLVYRQDSAEAVQRLRLRNIADGYYRLIEAPDELHSQRYSAAQLRDGIDISIEARQSARVFRIEREH
jgi:hypothetical protein